MKLNLNREYYEKSTIGELSIDGEFVCYMLERPWDDNKVRVSCIPEGEYPLTLKKYGRFHERWKGKSWYKGVIKLEDTEPRTEILIILPTFPKRLMGVLHLEPHGRKIMLVSLE